MKKIALPLLLVITAAALVWFLVASFNQTFQTALDPLQQANNDLATQVTNLLHPTPTILPDPVTIVHEVRSLARLETIQYTVEKVITAEFNQGLLGPLFGDKLLFVGHGTVIAGIDLEKLAPEDLWVEDGVLYARLPPAEIFIAALDNEKSYVYDRETGLFTHGDPNLETTARQVAEQEIEKAAIEDGILYLAQTNAETYLERLLRALGFPEVIFAESTP
ncbi:MAG: DUF4230 domain-containing protein [Chloroflexi bacterium]|nr:DUF4230 domain-containing protein [Chloroflexota bacterium]